jgi:hypothetical protein
LGARRARLKTLAAIGKAARHVASGGRSPSAVGICDEPSVFAANAGALRRFALAERDPQQKIAISFNFLKIARSLR